jgi:hypothetical protein
MNLLEPKKGEAGLILLDYSATLVSNFSERAKWYAINRINPYEGWIKKERIRMNLVDMLKAGNYKVILITARPIEYQEITLEQIKMQTGGWLPDEWYFNEWKANPPNCKLRILKNYIYPKYGKKGSRFMAIESNQQTRSMYKKAGIHALCYNSDWIEIPVKQR